MRGEKGHGALVETKRRATGRAMPSYRSLTYNRPEVRKRVIGSASASCIDSRLKTQRATAIPNAA
jgi:hypothetical protein